MRFVTPEEAVYRRSVIAAQAQAQAQALARARAMRRNGLSVQPGIAAMPKLTDGNRETKFVVITHNK
jgi:hypothetical protein